MEMLQAVVGQGYYRGFLIEECDKNQKSYQCFWISIIGKGKFKNHPKFGSTKGTTTLIVAIRDSNQIKHNSLQLCLDNSLEKEGNLYRIFHNGAMTNGKSGRVCNKKVIDYVKKHRSELVKNNKINLGVMPFKKEISWSLGEDHIYRLLVYASLRDKLRKRLMKKLI